MLARVLDSDGMERLACEGPIVQCVGEGICWVKMKKALEYQLLFSPGKAQRTVSRLWQIPVPLLTASDIEHDKSVG